jgi:SAM-dependent methyltransferase
MLRKLYYLLSPNLRLFARKLYYLPVDIYESITGQRGKYEPRKGDIYIGSGDFVSQGHHQVDLLKKFIALKVSDSVLDIGSGIGRTAIPLTAYLGNDGRYEGFDVVEKGVIWCNKTIKKDFPNFNFTYVALNNDLYNNSLQKAKEFTFPYQDKEFDKSFLFSVFTHMQVEDIDHYLAEIARVTKSGGLCLATFFLYDEQREEAISNQANFNFPVKKDGYRLMDAQVKAANIAISMDKLNAMIEGNPLKIVKIVNGHWNAKVSKTNENTFQDVVIIKVN